jgi:hypothetical protein
MTEAMIPPMYPAIVLNAILNVAPHKKYIAQA